MPELIKEYSFDLEYNKKTYSVFYYNSKGNTNANINNCCEAYLYMGDGQTISVGDAKFEIEKNDLIVLNQFEIHKIDRYNDFINECYALRIHPQFLVMNSTEKTDLTSCFYDRDRFERKVRLSSDDALNLEKIFSSLKENDGFGDDIIGKTEIIKAVVLINRYLMKRGGQATKFLYRSNTIIESVMKYVNENLCSDINLDDISKMNYISKNHLCRIFKKHTGTTLISYITSRRIAEAKKFLSEGYDVKDTCEKCGFNDYSHFIKTFKKIVGVPPKQYCSLKEVKNGDNNKSKQ